MANDNTKKNINMIEEFKALAHDVDVATEQGQLKATKTNQLASTAFFIMRDGSSHDRVQLKRLVSKEGELKQHKGTVAKVKAVYEALKDGKEITLNIKENGETHEEVFNLNSFKDFSFASPPSVTFSTLYTSLRKETIAEREEREIRELCVALVEEEHGNTSIELLKETFTSEELESMIEKKRTEAVAELGMDKPAANTVDKLKGNIAKLDDASLKEIAEYALSLIGTTQQEREAA